MDEDSEPLDEHNVDKLITDAAMSMLSDVHTDNTEECVVSDVQYVINESITKDVAITDQKKRKRKRECNVLLDSWSTRKYFS